MSMRISSAVLLGSVALAGCGEPRTDHGTLAKVETDSRARRASDDSIVCAQGGSTDFARTCTLDRADSDSGLILTVRHPNGAFHRLLVTRDGRGVIAADGAEKAVVTVIGSGEIEVALGGDRYRLPATVRSTGAGGSPAKNS